MRKTKPNNGIFVFRDTISSDDDEDEDELDSRNCTIDDEQNESLIIHPRVVLPQSSTKKRLLTDLNQDVDLQNKRLRYEDSTQSITFECYTSNDNLTRPFLVQTDIKLINNSCLSSTDQQTLLTDETLSSSTTTINSTKTKSSSSIETSSIAHRFISKKIFKPETCFVVNIEIYTKNH